MTTTIRVGRFQGQKPRGRRILKNKEKRLKYIFVDFPRKINNIIISSVRKTRKYSRK